MSDKENDNQQKKPSKPHKHLSRKKILVIITSIILSIIIGTCVIYFGLNKNNDKTKSDDTFLNHKKRTDKMTDIIADGGVEAGKTYLDNELKKTSDAKERSQIYQDKAVLIASHLGGEDKETALGYAYKAEEIYPSEGTALLIASIEDDLGHISNAIKYYKLYLSRLPNKTDSLNKTDYDFYSARLSELESGSNR